MILVLDTSAVVKLFFEEPGTGAMRERADRGDPIAAHVITYAEVCAAFARRSRERGDLALGHALRAELDEVIPDWNWVAADWPLVRRAATLAQRFAMRGYDSVQLAAAERVAAEAPATFACFDRRLTEAARALGLTVFDG